MKKSCVCLCIVFSMLFCNATYANNLDNNVSILYGDIDEDGVLTANDAASILQYVLTSKLDEDAIKRVDTDGNNIVDANDAACIMQKTLNNGFTLPIEKEIDAVLRYYTVKSSNVRNWTLEEDYAVIKSYDEYISYWNEKKTVFSELNAKTYDESYFNDKMLVLCSRGITSISLKCEITNAYYSDGVLNVDTKITYPDGSMLMAVGESINVIEMSQAAEINDVVSNVNIVYPADWNLN